MRDSPPMIDIIMNAFTMRRSVHTIPQVYHVMHLKEITLIVCQSIPCECVGKLRENGQ